MKNSTELQTAIDKAAAAAVRKRIATVSPHMILHHLLVDGEGSCAMMIKYLKGDLESIRQRVATIVGKRLDTEVSTLQEGASPRLNRECQTMLENAHALAASLGMPAVYGFHFLIQLINDGQPFGISTENATEMVMSFIRDHYMVAANDAPPPEGPKTEEQPSAPTAQAPARTPFLSKFAVDLVARARDGKLDRVVGREKEILRMTQILLRRTKNNPLLIGEAGVGKTAVVEGMAIAIAEGAAHPDILQKRIFTLDLPLMVAGTAFRGQFEERIQGVLAECRADKNIVLFIDEIHTVVGAGGPAGGMDVANMFKPALSRSELHCIGATTLNEYRKYIEKDSALDRRFQTVKVEEPSEADAIEILRGIRPLYEQHHGLTITDDAIVTAVKTSLRYNTARFLPDKAIDLLDETASRCAIEHCGRRKNVDPARIAEIAKMKEDEHQQAALGNYDVATKLRDQGKALRETLEKEQATAQKPSVTACLILDTASDVYANPMIKQSADMDKVALSITDILNERVIGQEQSAKAVGAAIRRGRANIRDRRRPTASFLFLGPTGVGKSLTAKTLSEQLLGSADAIIQLDMSEYMEKHTVSRLIGSPPGYVGYEEGGQLTEAVRRRPYAVVLFDELEKAHPDVLKLLLQILEDGRLTDSLGRTVDFRNTIIIMTSNVGAHLLQRQTSLGFAAVKAGANDDSVVRAKVLEEAKRVFAPEFLNRISDTVVFLPLKKDNMEAIVDHELQFLIDRVAATGRKLHPLREAVLWLAQHGYSQEYGARPLRRLIESTVEDKLADMFLRGDAPPGTNLVLAVEKDSLVIRVAVSEPALEPAVTG